MLITYLHSNYVFSYVLLAVLNLRKDSPAKDERCPIWRKSFFHRWNKKHVLVVGQSFVFASEIVGWAFIFSFWPVTSLHKRKFFLSGHLGEDRRVLVFEWRLFYYLVYASVRSRDNGALLWACRYFQVSWHTCFIRIWINIYHHQPTTFIGKC